MIKQQLKAHEVFPWPRDTPLNSPHLTMLFLSLSQSQQPSNNSNKVEAAFFFFFFVAWSPLLSHFYLSHSPSLCACALAPLSVCCLCEGAWARERKQRAASFGSAVDVTSITCIRASCLCVSVFGLWLAITT